MEILEFVNNVDKAKNLLWDCEGIECRDCPFNRRREPCQIRLEAEKIKDILTKQKTYCQHCGQTIKKED